LFAFLLYVVAPKCQVGSATTGSRLACYIADVRCNFQEETEATKGKAGAAKEQLAEEREKIRRLKAQLAAMNGMFLFFVIFIFCLFDESTLSSSTLLLVQSRVRRSSLKPERATWP
jgi:hypothetical protein